MISEVWMGSESRVAQGWIRMNSLHNSSKLELEGVVCLDSTLQVQGEQDDEEGKGKTPSSRMK